MAKFSSASFPFVWLLSCPALGFAAESSTTLSETELAGSLAKSLLVLAVLWVLSRMVVRRQKVSLKTSARMRVLESLVLERGQRVALVQIDQRELLIACSPSGICSLGYVARDKEGSNASATPDSRDLEAQSLQNSISLDERGHVVC